MVNGQTITKVRTHCVVGCGWKQAKELTVGNRLLRYVGHVRCPRCAGRVLVTVTVVRRDLALTAK